MIGLILLISMLIFIAIEYYKACKFINVYEEWKAKEE